MPDPPRGEGELRALAERFGEAETRIRALIAHAPTGDRRGLLGEALKILTELRRQDFRGPVLVAYLATLRDAGGGPRARTVRDLAGSLAAKLDRGAQTAASSAREGFRAVTADNLDEIMAAAVTAHVDGAGKSWPLGAWATMNTQTIGRQASSRGVSDALGAGGKVVVEVGECAYCQEFAGEAIISSDPLPPFHPSCSCVAS